MQIDREIRLMVFGWVLAHLSKFTHRAIEIFMQDWQDRRTAKRKLTELAGIDEVRKFLADHPDIRENNLVGKSSSSNVKTLIWRLIGWWV